METLGQRIKRLRKEKGMTQEALAKASGSAQSTISTLEADLRGKRPDLLAIDTGCVWGGALTAVRVDAGRREIVQVRCEQARTPHA